MKHLILLMALLTVVYCEDPDDMVTPREFYPIDIRDDNYL